MKKFLAAGAAIATAATLAVAPIADAKGKPGDQSIVEIAQSNGDFDTLVAAVLCADPLVLETLTSGDKYTVFAPTDAAFETTLGVDAGTVCDLPTGLLTDVLLYHVTEGRRFSNSVVPKGPQPRTIDPLLGASFQVNGNLEITDVDTGTAPTIVAPFNVNASNGVIHAIDEVLLPIQVS
ncbi:MAG: Nex18 symbiotically induced protein [Acidimicrobiaceae bacterium]|nr:Nex18 symbiotically induced protein [Acidimicrobiaceae bacterium]